MVFLNRSIPYFYFCIRVLFFATVASPIFAQASEPTLSNSSVEYSPTIESEQSLLEVEDDSLEFVPPAALSSGLESEIEPELVSTTDLHDGDVAGYEHQQYWLVSSRRAVQTIHSKNSGPWHLDVHRVETSGVSEASNVDLLKSQLTPGVPVCVFSHGSFVTWESNARQACQAFQRIRRASGDAPLQMIFFSWPSDGPYTYVPQLDVSVRGKRAEFNGFHLATLISCVPESCPVTVVGHSHGTRVTLSAMQLAAGGTVQGHTFTGAIGTQRRMRIVLAAGAIDHNWLNPGQRYGLALNRAECLLNLINQNDLPLAFYPFHRPFARRSIARAGITSRDTATLGYNAAKVRQIDVTNRLGGAHYWPDYYDDAQILATIVPYLVSY